MTETTTPADTTASRKPRHKSKTNWLGIGIAVFAGIQQFAPQLQAELTPSQYNWLLFIVGAGIVVLREFTKEPVR